MGLANCAFAQFKLLERWFLAGRNTRGYSGRNGRIPPIDAAILGNEVSGWDAAGNLSPLHKEQRYMDAFTPSRARR